MWGGPSVKWIRTPGEVEVALPPTYRYGALPLFAVAVLFILLAPVYWNETQARSATVAEACENADLYQYFYPTYNYAFARLRAGSLPLWNPQQLCGTPLLADPRVGVLQPLNLPFLFLPTERAFALHAFMCLFLMGLFFTLLARAVGVGYLAAALGGMIYAFSALSASAVARPPLAAALVWTPFLLWAVREYAYRFDTASAVLAGVAGALLILSGAYAFALATCIVAALYATQSLVMVERGSAEFMKRLRGLFVILGIALGISAAQWVPTLCYAARLDDPLSWIWGPHIAAAAPANARELAIQAVSNASAATPRAAYWGIVPLVFVPAAIFHRHRKRDVILFAAITIIPALLAAFFRWQLPLQFPVSAMLLPMIVSIALLAAIGADRVFTPRTTFRSPGIAFPVMLTLAICALLFVAFGADVRRYLVPCAAIVLLFAVIRHRMLTPVCFAALALVLLVDLTNANRTALTHPKHDAPACFETYAPALAAARDQALGSRIAPSAPELDRGLMPNIAMIASSSAVGASGIPLTPDQARWWEALSEKGPRPSGLASCRVSALAARPQLLRYMAARLVVAAPQGPLYDGVWAKQGPALREVTSVGSARMYVLDDALARAFWVPRVQVEVGMPATLDSLCSAGFDPGQVCVVDAQSVGIGALESLSAAEKATDAARPNATCSVEEVTPERVVIRVDAPRDGVTVLCDSYDPGWSAALDGRSAPVLKVNGLFRGVATSAGTHEIVFRYRPWSVYAGLGVACLVLVGALIHGVRTLAKPS